MLMFWVAALALSILLYVLLDGFDLGVGILSGLSRDDSDRRGMLAAISPVWDGNETWLICAGTVLFGAFPRVYALLMSAFYLPVIAMLAALIFRGIAFEFRHHATRSRAVWDFGLAAGSLLASFIQGTMVGALAHGLPMREGAYVGGPFGWCSGFALLCGVGLCVGYTLLGASWLVAKSEGEVQARAARLVPPLTLGVVIILAFTFAQALTEDLHILHRWLERPILFLFPAAGLAAALPLLRGTRGHHDAVPLVLAATIFAMAFGMLAASFWPDIVPFHISIDEAAAPRESLSFMFWGAGLFILPLVLAYNLITYRVFAGKLTSHHPVD